MDVARDANANNAKIIKDAARAPPQKSTTCAQASGGTASAALMGLLCEYASPGKAWANHGISG